MTDPNVPAIPSTPAIPDDDSSGGYELTIDLSTWGWNEERGKLLHEPSGLDLLIDGKPNPAVGDWMRDRGMVVEE